MVTRKIRVLVADDSQLIRELLCDWIAQSAELEVAGTAASGAEALAKTQSLAPDIVSLDVQMPGMDGLTALAQMLAARPIPVVMVSAVTKPLAEASLQALELGALDYLAKPAVDAQTNAHFRAEFIHKLRTLAGADVARLLSIRRARKNRPPSPKTILSTEASFAKETQPTSCIALGISTGGPPLLSDLFAALAPPLPPILVVQHMPAAFTGPFAKRLDGLSQLSIGEAVTGDQLSANRVYIAPGGRHLRLLSDGKRVIVRISDAPPTSGHRPSIDLMMRDAAANFGQQTLGIIMTGMGHDGVAGCQAIRTVGGVVLGQNQATSAVYGMNKAAFTSGWVSEQFAPDDLPALIYRHLAHSAQSAAI